MWRILMVTIFLVNICGASIVVKDNVIYHYDDNDVLRKVVTKYRHHQTTIYYNEVGNIHKENGPAFISEDDSGNIICVSFYHNGALHNDNGPAMITNYEGVYEEKYFRHGIVHRDGGPALIVVYKTRTYHAWFIDGKLQKEVWFK